MPIPKINYAKAYADFLGSFIKVRHPIRVVFDCSDGTAGVVLREFLSAHSRITHWVLNGKPNGRFPAHGPNPMVGRAMDDLGREVTERKADLGIVFDGDGDRVFFVDDRGNRLNPDVAAFLISKNFRGPTIVDVRSGFALREGLRRDRKEVVDCRVGHFFIKKLMRKENVSFGAEVSGHYYFKDFFYADSGILAAIYLVNEVSKLAENGERLSGWVGRLGKVFASGELNFEVEDKSGAIGRIEEAFKRRARTVSKLDGIRMDFGSPRKSAVHSEAPQSGAKRAMHSEALAKEWWFSVRPSNTENLLRLNLEAKDKKVFTEHLKELKALIGA